MKVLFVDSCIKPGNESRTRILCEHFLSELKKAHPDYDIEKVTLKDLDLKPFYQKDVEKRYALIDAGAMDDPMFDLANQFAGADRVVIGAPYWDMAFPSVLKIYIEHIYVGGITFEATDNGLKGLSRCEKVMFIQTAGGFVGEKDPGTEYLKYAMSILGPQDFQRISADFIDVVGIDVDAKLEETKNALTAAAKDW